MYVYIPQRSTVNQSKYISNTVYISLVEYHHIIWCSLCTYSVFILLFITWMDEELNPKKNPLRLKVSQFLQFNCNVFYIYDLMHYWEKNLYFMWQVRLYTKEIGTTSFILWLYVRSRLRAFNIPQICLPTTVVCLYPK